MKWSFFLITIACIGLMSSCKNKSATATSTYQEGFIGVGDSVQLFYQKIGEGESKLIVPAGCYIYDGMKSLVDSSDRTIVFYDPRNRGKSSHITDSTLIGIWQDVEDLESKKTFRV